MTQPVEVTVQRLYRLKDPGCARLRVAFDQVGVTSRRNRAEGPACGVRPQLVRGWTAARIRRGCAAANQEGQP
jgi:hypothetical protein